MSFLQAEIASIHSAEEESFVIANIRESTEYSTSALYWLGGQLAAKNTDHWEWVDGTPFTFSGNVSFCNVRNHANDPLYVITYHRAKILSSAEYKT